MAGFDFGKIPLSVPCPQCGKEIKETVAELERVGPFPCPHCGKLVRIGFAKGAAAEEKAALDKVKKAFRKP